MSEAARNSRKTRKLCGKQVKEKKKKNVKSFLAPNSGLIHHHRRIFQGRASTWSTSRLKGAGYHQGRTSFCYKGRKKRNKIRRFFLFSIESLQSTLSQSLKILDATFLCKRQASNGQAQKQQQEAISTRRVPHCHFSFSANKCNSINITNAAPGMTIPHLCILRS